MSFVDSRPTSAKVTAIADSWVLSISKTDIAKKLQQDTAFAARFYRAIALVLSDRMRAVTGTLAYGKAREIEELIKLEGEVDPSILDRVHLAGLKFDRVLQRLNR